MSFILEALKKSEQQRQQQNASEPKVRKRTLALQSSHPGRRLSPWLLVGLLTLIVPGGWWLYSQSNGTTVSAPVVEQTTPTPAPPMPPATVETVPATPAALPEPVVASTPQPQVVDVEPAPVPRSLGSTPAVGPNAGAKQASAAAPMPGQPAAPVPRKRLVDEPAAVASEQLESQVGSSREGAQASSQLPLYNDLSRELRAQMPPLDMSLHFYTPEAGRRMVRINDHLLHEGNWVDSNLQLVEVTATGAILDFLGKSFELRRARR